MSNGTSVRLMIFIDGTNFLCELGRQIDEEINAAKPDEAYIEVCTQLINGIENIVSKSRTRTSFFRIRRYWFGSYVGNDEYLHEISETFRKNDFEPVLFKKIGNKEKGVDIALTRETLINAFNNNFDAALFFAGDEDYVELVKDIKRYGNIVHGSFFSSKSLSNKLKLSFDYFHDLNKNYGDIKGMYEATKQRHERQ